MPPLGIRTLIQRLFVATVVSVVCAGLLVGQSEQEFVQELRKVAEQGDANAQALFMLGYAYAKGRGVPQDFAEAVKWFRLAAEQGHALAQTSLGAMYLEQGASQDFAKAAKWLRLAAELGEPLAQAILGSVYNTGQGVVQDYVEAHKWLNLAAAQSSDKQKQFAENRDLIADKMTPQQIAEAQRLAREWKLKTWDELKKRLD